MDRAVHFALVGPGRAGTAITSALVRAGWRLTRVAGRDADSASARRLAGEFGAEFVAPADAGLGARVVVVATPDAAIPEAVEILAPSLQRSALVVHLAGSLGLEAFEALTHVRPDARVAAVHPLQTLPGRPDDAACLVGAWFAVEGDPDARILVEAVGGRAFAVTDRALYHAVACVASNHFVALMGQVERLAEAAGIPPEAFAPLLQATLANVSAAGARGALTGPVARGDATTVARHLGALPDGERAAYVALAREALRLTGRDDPVLEALLAEPLVEGVAS